MSRNTKKSIIWENGFPDQNVAKCSQKLAQNAPNSELQLDVTVSKNYHSRLFQRQMTVHATTYLYTKCDLYATSLKQSEFLAAG